MTDEDGLRIEAAEQYGFKRYGDEFCRFTCSEAELIAFAKACERAGRAQAAQMALNRANELSPGSQARIHLKALVSEISETNAEADKELAPLRKTACG